MILDWLPDNHLAHRDALLSWVVVLEQSLHDNAERFTPAEWEGLWACLAGVEIERCLPCPALILADCCGQGELADKVRSLDYAHAWALLYVLDSRRGLQLRRTPPARAWWEPGQLKRGRNQER